jgi:DNA invertase Pin-like site-specific DNA recombinase
MRSARRRECDVEIVWRFDRFARSVKHLVLALEEFQSLGIGFVSYQEALDTSTPIGKAMFTIIGAMAELERNVIRERVRAGVRNARKNGKALGRMRVIFDRSRAIELRDGGATIRDIADTLGVGRGTVQRFLAQNPIDNGLHQSIEFTRSAVPGFLGPQGN